MANGQMFFNKNAVGAAAIDTRAAMRKAGITLPPFKCQTIQESRECLNTVTSQASSLPIEKRNELAKAFSEALQARTGDKELAQKITNMLDKIDEPAVYRIGVKAILDPVISGYTVEKVMESCERFEKSSAPMSIAIGSFKSEKGREIAENAIYAILAEGPPSSSFKEVGIKLTNACSILQATSGKIEETLGKIEDGESRNIAAKAIAGHITSWTSDSDGVTFSFEIKTEAWGKNFKRAYVKENRKDVVLSELEKVVGLREGERLDGLVLRPLWPDNNYSAERKGNRLDISYDQNEDMKENVSNLCDNACKLQPQVAGIFAKVSSQGPREVARKAIQDVLETSGYFSFNSLLESVANISPALTEEQLGPIFASLTSERSRKVVAASLAEIISNSRESSVIAKLAALSNEIGDERANLVAVNAVRMAVPEIYLHSKPEKGGKNAAMGKVFALLSETKEDIKGALAPIRSKQLLHSAQIWLSFALTPKGEYDFSKEGHPRTIHMATPEKVRETCKLVKEANGIVNLALDEVTSIDTRLVNIASGKIDAVIYDWSPIGDEQSQKNLAEKCSVLVKFMREVPAETILNNGATIEI